MPYWSSPNGVAALGESAQRVQAVLRPCDGQHHLFVVQPGAHREDEASLLPLDRVRLYSAANSEELAVYSYLVVGRYRSGG